MKLKWDGDLLGDILGDDRARLHRSLLISAPAKTEWTSFSFRIDSIPPGELWYEHKQPDVPFKAHYCIVTTRGFSIQRATVGNQIFIEQSATDLYYVEEWDKLERLGQLARVRLSAPACAPENVMRILVKNERSTPGTFECGFIGEQVVSAERYLEDRDLPLKPGTGDAAIARAETLLAGDVGALGRYCSECGAPVGSPCHGTKRGTFHKRREKVKP